MRDDLDAPLMRPSEVVFEQENIAACVKIANRLLAAKYPNVSLRCRRHAIPNDLVCVLCGNKMQKKTHFVLLTRVGCGLAACKWCTKDILLDELVKDWCNDHVADLSLVSRPRIRNRRSAVSAELTLQRDMRPLRLMAKIVAEKQPKNSPIPVDRICRLCGANCPKRKDWYVLTKAGCGLAACKLCVNSPKLGELICALAGRFSKS